MIVPPVRRSGVPGKVCPNEKDGLLSRFQQAVMIFVGEYVPYSPHHEGAVSQFHR